MCTHTHSLPLSLICLFQVLSEALGPVGLWLKKEGILTNSVRMFLQGHFFPRRSRCSANGFFQTAHLPSAQHGYQRGRWQNQKQKHEFAARRCGKQKHVENQISQPTALKHVLHMFSHAQASALGEKKGTTGYVDGEGQRKEDLK